MKKIQDMTKGNLWAQIFLFGLPLVFSNLLQILFNMSDVAVVGKFAGTEALGAVGSTTTFVALFTEFLIGVGCGINAITAKYHGAKDYENLNKTVSSAPLLSLASGCAVMLAGLIFARPLLELLGTKPELISGAELYLRIYFCGMPALSMYNYGNAVLSAMGETKKPLIFLTIAGIINVILNLFFVIVCSLDVAGVAVASVISQYISAALVLVYLFRSQEFYRVRISKSDFCKKNLKELTVLGLPTGVQNAIFQIANLFVQGGVNTFDTTVVSGVAAAQNADALVYNPMQAYYTACSTFIGQNYGAQNKKRVRESYLISLLYAFGFGLILGWGVLLAGKGFLGIFTSSEAVADAGMLRLKVMGVSYCVSAFVDASIAASRGLGKSIVPTVMVIMGSCVFRIIWIYTVFARIGTVGSLFSVYVCSWIITAIAEIIYFVHTYCRAFTRSTEA